MTAKKKVIIDNDDILLYYPLTRDWCSYHEPWCKGFGGEQSKSEEITKIVNNRRGSAYILVTKGKHPKTYIIIGNRVPLRFDGQYTTLDDDLTGVNIKKLLAPNKQLRELLKVEYTLKERIKYDVGIEESELNDWAEINEFSSTIKGIMDNKVHMDELLHDDYLGDDLWEYEAYSYGEKNQVRVTPSGIELFVDNEVYMTDVANISDEDDFQYKQAMGIYYYGDYDEVDSEELDYMSCWLEPPTITKLSKLFKIFGVDKNEASACHDYDDSEINDFLHKHFPDEWENFGWDILSEAGRGLTETRTKNAKEFIEEDVAFEFEVGNSQTTMEISYSQLLFLIHVHDIKDLSGLISPDNNINEIEPGLYESWFDDYDFGREAYDEIDRIFSIWLDGLLDKGDELSVRKENGDKLEKIVTDLGFKLRPYNNAYELYVNDNNVMLKQIDLIDGTVQLTKTVKQPAPDNPEETLPAGELMSFRKTFQVDFDDIVNYVQSDEIFSYPAQEN